MNMGKKLWELTKDGILSDMTLIEKAKTGETQEYKVHKVIMYLYTDYYKKHLNVKMADSNTNTIVIPTQSCKLGLLAFVIEAIYKPKNSKEIYYNFANKYRVSRIMHLYNICCYLGIGKHINYIEKAIKEIVDLKYLVQWWSKQNAKGINIMVSIETYIQSQLYNTIISHYDEPFIPINIVLALWPEHTNNLITDNYRKYLENYKA
jgi:hypothetical protein